MDQYDRIAKSYDRVNEERHDRACILVPTAERILGDLTGLDALDLACGSGFFSRRMKAWGARRVVGVDLSQGMLDLAHGEGIEYRKGDVSEMGKLGEFDLAFGGFLLHYAPSVENLRAMCRNIALNLKPGARFVAFNENPFFPVHEGVQYDVIATPSGPIADGVQVKRTHMFEGKEDFSFTHFHYEPATYQDALEAAGFSNIRWSAFSKGRDADRAFPPGYWDAFTGDFSIRVLQCERA